MSGLNQVNLIGHLGKDPEMRYLPSGEAVANFSIATSETWTDKATGDKKEATEWHRISVFNKLAEICGQYLKKGSQVYVCGSLRTRKWQDKDGADRYTTEIRADTMRMLDKKGDGGGGDQRRDDGATRTKPAPAAAAPKRAASGFEDMDDDIPF